MPVQLYSIVQDVEIRQVEDTLGQPRLQYRLLYSPPDEIHSTEWSEWRAVKRVRYDAPAED